MVNKGKEGFVIRLSRLKFQIMDFLSPLAQVIMRVWVALIFWQSGILKFKSWDSTLFLFAEEYKTHEKLTFFGAQIMNAETSAILATTAELVLPLMLILGLGVRQAAFGLLIMTYVLEKTYSSIPSENTGIMSYIFLSEALHISWGIVLAALVLLGGGRFSWDFFIKAKYFGFNKEETDTSKLVAAFATICLSIYSLYLIITSFLL